MVIPNLPDGRQVYFGIYKGYILSTIKEKCMEKILNYIDGELVEPLSGNYLDNIDPAIGEVYSQIPDSDSADVENAISASKKAQESWANTSAEKRSAVIMKIADLIDRDLEKLTRAESIDNGKPISLARTVDIPRASANFDSMHRQL